MYNVYAIPVYMDKISLPVEPPAEQGQWSQTPVVDHAPPLW